MNRYFVERIYTRTCRSHEYLIISNRLELFITGRTSNYLIRKNVYKSGESTCYCQHNIDTFGMTKRLLPHILTPLLSRIARVTGIRRSKQRENSVLWPTYKRNQREWPCNNKDRIHGIRGAFFFCVPSDTGKIF